MCAACVAQGAVYMGGAVGTLRLMAARAASKRAASHADDDAPHEGSVVPAGLEDDDAVDRPGEYASTS